MSNFSSVLAPTVGVTALVLSVAYGVHTRGYLSEELSIAQQAEQRLEAQVADSAERLQTATEALKQAQADLAQAQERIAALEAAQSAAPVQPAPEPTQAVAAQAPPTEPAPHDLAAADPANGEKVFGKCRGCHQIGPGAENRAGPHLNDLFGRKAGSVEGFDYSESMERMSADGLVWDIEHLDAYFANPRALVSGTRMSFRGLKDAQDRRDVIAYLRQFSGNPQDLPESAPTAFRKEVELPPEILAIVGDEAYGEYLASECLTCHKVDGGDDGIPSIINWYEEDFVIAMHAYKRKLRPHPVMQMMAGRLSDEEIAALAAYFANLQ